MNTVLALEFTVGKTAFDFDGHAFDTGLFPARLINSRKLPVILFAKADIHTQQHARPILGVGTAGAGVNTENRVVIVVRAVQFEGFLERRKVGFKVS